MSSRKADAKVWVALVAEMKKSKTLQSKLMETNNQMQKTLSETNAVIRKRCEVIKRLELSTVTASKQYNSSWKLYADLSSLKLACAKIDELLGQCQERNAAHESNGLVLIGDFDDYMLKFNIELDKHAKVIKELMDGIENNKELYQDVVPTSAINVNCEEILQAERDVLQQLFDELEELKWRGDIVRKEYVSVVDETRELRNALLQKVECKKDDGNERHSERSVETEEKRLQCAIKAGETQSKSPVDQLKEHVKLKSTKRTCESEILLQNYDDVQFLSDSAEGIVQEYLREVQLQEEIDPYFTTLNKELLHQDVADENLRSEIQAIQDLNRNEVQNVLDAQVTVEALTVEVRNTTNTMISLRNKFKASEMEVFGLFRQNDLLEGEDWEAFEENESTQFNADELHLWNGLVKFEEKSKQDASQHNTFLEELKKEIDDVLNRLKQYQSSIEGLELENSALEKEIEHWEKYTKKVIEEGTSEVTPIGEVDTDEMNESSAGVELGVEEFIIKQAQILEKMKAKSPANED